jgi:hypothetical protein
VTYLGPGDLHDATYDRYSLSVPVMVEANERIRNNYNLRRQGTLFYNNGMNIRDDSENGQPILYKTSNCSMYTISVYPSTGLYDSYTSSQPIAMAIGVSMSIIFLSFWYLCYIQRLEKEQTVITQQAKQTSAIVSSLFPAVVRDRLLNNNSTHNNYNRGGTITDPLLSNSSRHGNQTTKSRLMTFLQTGGTVSTEVLEEDNRRHSFGRKSTKPTYYNMKNHGMDDTILDMKPIAEYFLETTVSIGDISGFTAWSRSVIPTDTCCLCC